MKKNAKISAIALVILMLAITVVSTYGFLYGQSPNPPNADFVVLEGMAGEDYYDTIQYSYKVNQWASEMGLYQEFTPSDTYYNAEKSLRIALSEYGEFASPQHFGLAYGADHAEWDLTESWASVAINPKYWFQGWTLYVNYTRNAVARGLAAYALFSDGTTVEAARKVYTWFSNYQPNEAGAVLTLGSLAPSGVKVLYDSARLAIARASITIHDGYYDEDFAEVTITVVFNKVGKTATVFKDLKILLDNKILDSINDLAFSERYELDLARGVNSNNRSYIHYYDEGNESVYQHPLTGQNAVDFLQAFDPARQYIFFAGYWPNATEYSVYSTLVPDVPSDRNYVLPVGFARPDIPAAPVGPDEPSTPWVTVQWRYNSTCWGNMLTFLAEQGSEVTPPNNREIRFVEVIGMTDYNDDPNPALDAKVDQVNQLDAEVQYLLTQVFNPEDLTTLSPSPWSNGQVPFMWTGLGQSAATTDSGGAGFVADNIYGWWSTSMVMFDRNDTMFPWAAPVVGMKGSIPYGLVEFGGSYIESVTNTAHAGTQASPTTFWRTALKGFAFDIYDDDWPEYLPPQPISGGWSRDGDYWYPSKNPLTERWSGSMVGYDDVDYSPNGIITLGGVKANGLARYFNDFGYAITREGTSGTYRALINGGAVSGSVPTSNPSSATLDFFPVSSWNSQDETWGYKEGYAVINLVRDVNGTRGLSIYGWDGRDTFWAAAWASQYIMGPSSSWIIPGTVSVIINIEYNDAMEPTTFTVVKALGTITELGSNMFASDPQYGFDTICGQRSVPVWTGEITIGSYPSGWGYYKVWWFEKLYTESIAEVEFDP